MRASFADASSKASAEGGTGKVPVAPRAVWVLLGMALFVLGAAGPGAAQQGLAPATPPHPSLAAGFGRHRVPQPVMPESVYVDADPYYKSMPEPGPVLIGPEPTHIPYMPLPAAPVWECLPDGLVYRTYLAGVKEPRMASHMFYETSRGWLLDATMGARVGLFRHTPAFDATVWQLDVEAAAFPRIDLERDWDLVSSDFRFGVPLTWGWGDWQAKFGYYHLSSHLGDEEIINGDAELEDRINYSRDALILGISYYVMPAWRVYAEAGWAFRTRGGAEEWEFQFGTEFSSLEPTGAMGSPFAAIHGHLREELNYSGDLVVQAGWQWRSLSGRLLRVGLHYFNGHSNQYQFFREHEHQIGGGVWYDF